MANINLYYVNPQTNKLELVSDNNIVTDRNVQINLTHCSDYVLSKTAITTQSTPTPTTPPSTGVAE